MTDARGPYIDANGISTLGYQNTETKSLATRSEFAGEALGGDRDVNVGIRTRPFAFIFLRQWFFTVNFAFLPFPAAELQDPLREYYFRRARSFSFFSGDRRGLTVCQEGRGHLGHLVSEPLFFEFNCFLHHNIGMSLFYFLFPFRSYGIPVVRPPVYIPVLKCSKVVFDPGCEATINTTDGTPLPSPQRYTVLNEHIYHRYYWRFLLHHVEAPTVADATMSTFYKKDPEKIPAGASSSTKFFGERGRIFFIIPGRVSVPVSGGPGICYAPRSKVGINILYNAFQAAKGSKSKVSGALS